MSNGKGDRDRTKDFQAYNETMDRIFANDINDLLPSDGDKHMTPESEQKLRALCETCINPNLCAVDKNGMFNPSACTYIRKEENHE